MLKDWYPPGKGRGAIFGVALFFVFAVGFFVSGNVTHAASAAPSVPAPAAGGPVALPADHLIDVLNKTPGPRGETAADASAFVGTVKIGGAVLDAVRSALQIASLDVLGSVAITATGEQGLRLSLGGGKNDLSIYRDNDVGDWTLLRTDKGNGIGLIGQPDVIALAVSRINGNVGIGTTSPQSKLTISRDVAASAAQLELRDAGNIGDGQYNALRFTQGTTGSTPLGSIRAMYRNSGNPDLAFFTRDFGTYVETEKMRIGSNGNVGIGTTNPDVKLDVLLPNSNGASKQKALRLIQDNQNTLQVNMYGGDTDLMQLAAVNKEQNISIVTEDDSLLDAGTTKGIYIKSGGNVGIGTTSPSNDHEWKKVLDVHGTDHAKSLVTNDAGIKVGLFAHNSWDGAAGSVGTESNHPLRFLTNNSEKMRIFTDGNVGIGTTEPVVGGEGFTGIDLRGTNGSSVVLGKSSRGAPPAYLYSDSAYLNFQTPDYIALRPGSSEKMRITSSGNVGIGTADPTPELSGARLLQIDDEDHAIIGLRSTFPNDAKRFDIRMSLGTLSNNEFDRAVIATESAHPLTFNTENKFRVAILSTGEFQIGTANLSSPSALLLAQKDGDDPAASDVFRVQRSSEVRDNRIIPDLTVDDRGVVIVSGDAPNDTDKSVKLFVNGRVDAENYCIKGTTNCVTDFKNIGPWKETGNNIYNENSGNIGIGTAIPNDKLQIGNTFAFHDGGHKLIGFGFNPSNGKALMDGYPAEIRWIPNNTSSSGSALHIGIEDSLRTRGQDVSVWEKWGITLKPGGNVGIGTTNPGTQLSVNGPASFGKVIQNVFKVGPFGNNPGPLFFYINTKIPFTDSPSPQLKITGYNYGNGNRAISFTLGWYVYQNTFHWSQVQGDIGYYMPSRIRLGTWNDAGTKRIRIEIANDETYWSSYSISAFDSNGPVSHYEGWTSAEGDFPGDTGNITTVNHASGVVYTNTGNVGIGTTNPGARLSIKTTDNNALDVRGKSDSWLGLLSSNAKNFSGFFSDKDHDVNLALRRGSGDYGVYLRSNGNSYFGGADHTGLWVASPNNKDSYINFYTSDHNRWSIGKYGSSNETYSRGLYFYEDHTDVGTGGGSAGTRMFIAPGGNVGIGTTDFQTGVQGNDNYKLHVQNGAGKSATVSIGRSDGQGGNLRGAGGGLQLVPAHNNGGTWNIMADDNQPVSGNAYLKTWYGGRNILTLVHNGNVGIGMDNPIAKLHVRVGESPHYYDGPQGLYIDINEQGTTPVGLAGTKFLQFRNETLDKIVMVVKRDGKTGIGTGNLCPGCQLNVEGGDINVGFFGENRFTELPEKTRVAYETDRVGLDVAELFETEEEVEIGEIVVVANEDRKLTRSSQQYQDTIVGVVSGAPAILFEGSELRMGANPNRFEKGTKPPVALAGRIPVKVSLENGSIKPGDYLTSSSNPGVAMKATEPGMAIGVALEKYNEQSKGDTVLVFLNLGDKNSDVLIKRLESLERRLRAFEFKPRW